MPATIGALMDNLGRINVLGGIQRNLQSAVTVAKPSDNSRAIVGNLYGQGTPVQAVSVRATESEAVFQTDRLPTSSMAAGASFVAEFGAIQFILDLGASGNLIERGAITMIDPNGVPHDMYGVSFQKTSEVKTPVFPPGKYTFINTSGGALPATMWVVIYHYGNRNLL